MNAVWFSDLLFISCVWLIRSGNNGKKIQEWKYFESFSSNFHSLQNKSLAKIKKGSEENRRHITLSYSAISQEAKNTVKYRKIIVRIFSLRFSFHCSKSKVLKSRKGGRNTEVPLSHPAISQEAKKYRQISWKYRTCIFSPITATNPKLKSRKGRKENRGSIISLKHQPWTQKNTVKYKKISYVYLFCFHSLHQIKR